ncbi:hypothetical protein LEP1GSC051_3593 [Leptospira sp. P2653]|nr:hypothetical protein LEP1GSC051_3593 [Leptospira sp. P2653]
MGLELIVEFGKVFLGFILYGRKSILRKFPKYVIYLSRIVCFLKNK